MFMFNSKMNKYKFINFNFFEWLFKNCIRSYGDKQRLRKKQLSNRVFCWFFPWR